ncbi:class II fructose-bisphosphate aldolase [Gleimia sp. 6138-11-ORH1]|uniref:class II fructose-bisphosphate aldolase n=1 Tax=Gleimia sp. 6138-11-ORH1 TaxID=2973937 RepID=UPI00216A7F30|nr:class II fructose-bisphosphate aldolase [Gleimia sp. 6138-11-ORH1]MCS4484790.1 class II fructose-bisphosphate aldolase [Gleimia sp. 6138-11-ORH1]
MPLVDIRKMAAEAAAQKVGLGAFNVVLLEFAAAQIDAAERVNRPIILQLSQNAVKYHGGRLAPLGKAMIALAEGASVPVAVHLDHAEDVDLCRAAVDLGFNSVMYDGSHLDDETNRETTAKVVEFCHAAGVAVEAELGEVGGKNGVHDPSARTNPEDAAKFVADTGVDLLAVAVGSSHAMTTRGAVLDTDLIAAIRDAVPVPLVLHGSSGVSDEGMVAAIKAGMTKINVSTHLNVGFTAVVREILSGDEKLVDPRKYIGPGRDHVTEEVARLLTLYATA